MHSCSILVQSIRSCYTPYSLSLSFARFLYIICVFILNRTKNKYLHPYNRNQVRIISSFNRRISDTYMLDIVCVCVSVRVYTNIEGNKITFVYFILSHDGKPLEPFERYMYILGYCFFFSFHFVSFFFFSSFCFISFH